MFTAIVTFAIAYVAVAYHYHRINTILSGSERKK